MCPTSQASKTAAAPAAHASDTASPPPRRFLPIYIDPTWNDTWGGGSKLGWDKVDTISSSGSMEALR